MNSILCVIPARYNSKRFPGKILANISGKPLIQWVWEKAKKVKLIDRVIIATDNRRILDTVKQFKAEVVMTSKKCKSGTDRVAEVARKISSDIVVDLQGDEPLISPSTITKTIKALIRDKKSVVSTPVCKFNSKNNFTCITNPNYVKVVFDKNNYALYFSRSVIPFLSQHSSLSTNDYFYKHIGLYVYRSKFLNKFVKLPQSKLEKTEQLEQLRILENGYKIKVVPVSEDTIPVDRPEDINVVARFIGLKSL